ncbi:MAG: hypothetical protein KAV87_33765 [Desulfobacteraceae bacterium]|nr:hypothetical protein [Desulfobacteraceae bacterium]
MLTLFSIPKQFQDDTAIVQRNAIQSWTHLKPRPDIILFGDDKGTAEVAAEFGIRHVPGIACNEFGTPLVSALFETAEREAKGNVLCYVNADIILLSDFMSALEQIMHRKRRFLAAGQRWDVDIKEPLKFGPRWEEQLRAMVTQNGQLHPPTGIDYFIFTHGLWGNIPPFAIGRTVWDNWLLYKARASKAPLIDASEVVMAVHQNHGYSHVPNGFEGAWKGSEAVRNLELSGGSSYIFTLQDADWVLTARGLKKPKLTRERIGRQLDALAVLRPRLAPVFRLVKKCLILLNRPFRVTGKAK